MSKVIGIDLGTSNSCAAVMEAGSPKVINNEEGLRTTPSMVAFNKGEIMVGSPARRQAVTNPKNTVYSAKRFMGMKFSEVEKEASNMPFEVKKSPSGMCTIVAGDKELTPQEISANILSKMKTAAERYLGEEVTRAVITVPAYFNDSQRQATRDAGKIAGLEVERIINEPTAAALAYGLNKGDQRNILVYDLGGGTFDVSVLEIGDGVVEVLSTNGNTHLGGDDVDKLIIDYLVEKFKESSGVDVAGDSMVMQRLREAAEKAKIELSSTQQTNINLPFLTADNTGPKHLILDLTRSEFERMIDPLIEKTMTPVLNALEDAGLEKGNIDEILLVGGSTRIPAVIERVETYFEKKSSSSVNPDEVVALGAAVQGGVFVGEVNDILLLDVTPLSLGLETMGGIMTRLIDRNTTIPCTKSQVFTTAEDNQPAVDIKVLQGEREFSKDNKMLGNFKLDGITPAPRGIPQIEVSFDIDANGLVSVSAKDKNSGKEQNITITGSGAMTPEEIDKLVEEARDNEEADKLKKKTIEERNQLNGLIFQSEKLLRENEGKLQEADVTLLKQGIQESKEILLSEDTPDLQEYISKLSSALQEAAKILYSQASEAESPSSPPEPDITNSEGDDDDIIDAEFSEA